MISEMKLDTQMGPLRIRINDHDKLPDVSISIDVHGEEFELAIVEVDQFDPDDMSVNVKVFGEPKHREPSHQVTIYDARLEKLAIKRQMSHNT